VLASAFAQLSRVSTATITKSEEMARRLPPQTRSRNYVIPNGVDLSGFTPMDRSEARRCMGWGSDQPNILFVGNPANPRKNFALASAVCDELARRGTPVALRVAWEVGPTEMPLWMNAADVLLFPSLSEGSPNTVKEAMATELPIVSAPVGDVPERLAGVAGTFVVKRTVGPMADAVASALDVQRAPAARKAVQEISVDRVATKVVDVYRQATSRLGQVNLTRGLGSRQPTGDERALGSEITLGGP
jgi:glycosyltransferase involved in cell wall biosynthesis